MRARITLIENETFNKLFNWSDARTKFYLLMLQVGLMILEGKFIYMYINFQLTSFHSSSSSAFHKSPVVQPPVEDI